jgi:hypothetical protein
VVRRIAFVCLALGGPLTLVVLAVVGPILLIGNAGVGSVAHVALITSGMGALAGVTWVVGRRAGLTAGQLAPAVGLLAWFSGACLVVQPAYVAAVRQRGPVGALTEAWASLGVGETALFGLLVPPAVGMAAALHAWGQRDPTPREASTFVMRAALLLLPGLGMAILLQVGGRAELGEHVFTFTITALFTTLFTGVVFSSVFLSALLRVPPPSAP